MLPRFIATFTMFPLQRGRFKGNIIPIRVLICQDYLLLFPFFKIILSFRTLLLNDCLLSIHSTFLWLVQIESLRFEIVYDARSADALDREHQLRFFAKQFAIWACKWVRTLSCCVAIFWLSEITLFNRFISALRFLTSAGSAPPVRLPRITAAETAAAARFGFRRASPCSLSFYTSSKVFCLQLLPQIKKNHDVKIGSGNCNILAW